MKDTTSVSLSDTREALPSVSVIVVNFNGHECLGKILDTCVESVLKVEYPDFEVLFVDNASTDDSVSYVREKFKAYSKLRVIKLDKNYGYSGGVSKGVKHASNDIVAVVNTDVIVSSNWLIEAVRTAQSDEKIGIVSSKILVQQPRCQTGGGEIDILLVGNDRLIRGKELPLKCFHPSGAAFLFRRRLADTLGELFDNSFFAYFEDVDLGWRCQLMGFEVLYCPASIAFHRRGSSFGLASPLKFRLMRRNALMSATKNTCTSNFLKLLPIWLISTLYASHLFYRASGKARYQIYGLMIIFEYLLNLRKVWNKHALMQTIRKVDDDAVFAKFSNTLFINDPNAMASRVGFALVRSWLRMFRIKVRIKGFKTYPTLELLKTSE